MQKMIRSPAGPGTIGPLWSLHLVAAIYARRLNRATTAAAVARAGIKMSKKYNTESTKIKKFHDEWCLANGYKLSSKSRQDFKPSRKGSSFKPKSTSSRIREPG